MLARRQLGRVEFGEVHFERHCGKSCVKEFGLVDVFECREIPKGWEVPVEVASMDCECGEGGKMTTAGLV